MVAAPWEEQAGIHELGAIAEVADRLGFHHLTCSEHVAVPTDVARLRGATYWDPLATFGYLAARTTRIRLATQVRVLGYHHPLEIAKRYGTLDRVSGGRLILGLGVGCLEEEFELLGAPFPGRGARADDALAAPRASLGVEEPTYAGSHYEFKDLVVRPAVHQQRGADVDRWTPPEVPEACGGAGRRRGAVRLGPDRALRAPGRVELRGGFDVVLPTGRLLDPSGRPEHAAEQVAATAETGATIVSVSLRASSAAHYVEQLEALAGLVDLTAP